MSTMTAPPTVLRKNPLDDSATARREMFEAWYEETSVALERALRDANNAEIESLMLDRELELFAEELNEAPTEARTLIGRPAWQVLLETPEDVQWLIPGVLPRGWLVKLAAREKVGKGTLISYLIACGERGETTVFSEEQALKFKTCIVTEEPVESLREKLMLFGIHEAHVIYGAEIDSARDREILLTSDRENSPPLIAVSR